MFKHTLDQVLSKKGEPVPRCTTPGYATTVAQIKLI